MGVGSLIRGIIGAMRSGRGRQGLLCGAVAAIAVEGAPSAGPVVGAKAGVPARSAAEPTYTLTVETRQLMDLLRGQVFTDSGRFYPCRTNPSCSAWGQDIALSNPSLAIDGPRLVFSVHLVGNYALSAFFAATVSGDLIVSGVPVNRGRRVILTQTQAMAGPQSDMTFQAFLQAMHGRIESMLDQSPGFDLGQYLSYAASDPQLPPPRLPNTSCVDPSQIQVQSIATQPATSAINAVVSVAPAQPGTSCLAAAR
jgi:hypothetical protein